MIDAVTAPLNMLLICGAIHSATIRSVAIGICSFICLLLHLLIMLPHLQLLVRHSFTPARFLSITIYTHNFVFSVLPDSLAA